MEYKVNDVLMDMERLERYRILWISPDGRDCWWITVDGKKRTPDKVQVRELESMGNRGRLVRADDPAPRAPALSAAQEERRDKKFAVIEHAVRMEPEIYDPHGRAAILAQAERETGVKAPNLYGYLARYWKGGKTRDAFAPGAGDRRGRCRDYTKGQYRPLGRKRREGSPGKVLTPEDFRHFSQAVRKYYLAENKVSLQDTYENMLKDCYRMPSPGEGGGQEARMKPPGELPSFMQFRYWYRKNRDVVAEVKKREGEGAFERGCRAITGYTERKYPYPGAAYQIDATIADIFLVKENDRSAVIGRPVMYFVMDAYTRMVAGMHVTYRPPSWADAACALDNALTDKAVYCRRFGLEIKPEDWPCRQLPEALIADRGEMEGRQADVLASGLGIRIENTPPYRGDLKGIIEQHFRLINLEMGDLLPGKVRKDFGQRGARDYRLDAKLDIRQFTRIIIRCVLFHNNVHYMEGYRKEPQMRQMGVLPIPRELWNFGIRYRSGGLMTIPQEKARYALLPKEECSVTGRGIAFHGMYYTCPEAVEEHWFEKARIGGRRKLEAAYDPCSTASIYIMHEDGRYLSCSRTDLSGAGADTTFTEADDDHERDLDQQARHCHTELEEKARLGDFIDQEVKAAGEMSGASGEAPGSRRIAEIRKNREEAVRGEKEGAFAAPAQEAAGRGGAEEGKNREAQELDAVQKLIRRQLEERLRAMEE